MRIWGTPPPASTPGRGSPGWSRRWAWTTWAWCWASRCPGWPARDGSGISCFQLCALSGALLGDLDGIYDPGEHNDRLLLGLMGTISEAELHLIRQRMWSGRMAKAGRGELAVPLPIGLVRRASGEVALDPDEQVQAVVRLVFDALPAAGHDRGGAGLSGRCRHPAGRALPRAPRARGAGLAAAQPE